MVHVNPSRMYFAFHGSVLLEKSSPTIRSVGFVMKILETSRNDDDGTFSSFGMAVDHGNSTGGIPTPQGKEGLIKGIIIVVNNVF